MNFLRTKLHIGVPEPFQIIHLSDIHLTYADMRDGMRKVELAKDRQTAFPDAEEILAQADQVAKETGAPILCTGDFIDFVSLANLERAKAFIDDHDFYMAAGNHEFSLYVGEAKEDAAYRNQSLELVQSAFPNNIRCASRIIGGVNFVALDNGYYLFEPEQLTFLQREADKGYPMILLMHTPLFSKELYDITMSDSPCAYLTDVPEELMRNYPPDRYEQQLADSITHQTVEFIRTQPLIKAVIAGHIHKNYEGIVFDRIHQYTTACTTVRLFEIT